MKVLFTFGGMPHYLKALLEKLQGFDGVEIVVVVPRKGNATIGRGVKMVEGGTFRLLPAPERRMPYGKSGFPSLPAVVRDELPDIVVLGWPYFLQVFFQPGLRRALRAAGSRLAIREIPFQTPPYGGIRAYFRRHPMYDEEMRLMSRGFLFYLRQWVTARLRCYCYAHAAGTLNYCTAARDILPSYGVESGRIHVTYNASDTEALWRERAAVQAAPPLLPPSARRLLHIGRLVKWKRVDLLLEAFARVAERFPDAELLVVGDGPELDSLKRQAARLGLPVFGTEEADARGGVRFAGAAYDPHVLGAYMHESAVYVLAGMGGLSINDAMTYGLPVVCSVCDGTERDLVSEGRNGCFFREGDAADLADKLERLLSDTGLLQRMGKESERIIRERINLDAVARHYVEAFKALLS